MNSEDGQVYSVCILQFSSCTKYNSMQSKHKQTKCDETLTDYSFLSRNHTTKSKNYFKKQYRICHWIPMFIGTPCAIVINVWFNLGHSNVVNISLTFKCSHVVNTLLQNGFSNTYLSRYSSVLLNYLMTIYAKLKGTIFNLFIKTGNHTDTILWPINATTTGRDVFSYRCLYEH